MEAKTVVVVTAVIMASGCGASPNHASRHIPADALVPKSSTPLVEHGTVKRVVDGDTLHVLVAGSDVDVRLLGVDTPETHDPRKPVQCYGPQAAAFTTNYATAGSRVTIKTEPSTGDTIDKYGRTLAYVYVVAHHTDLGSVLLRRGFAKVYAFNNRHFLKRPLYERLQAKAQAAKIGRWGACP